MNDYFQGIPPKKKKPVKSVILLAVIAAAVILGLLLFFQVREVTDDKGFWENFGSADSQSQYVASQ
ncbi:hypothetical protein [Youxingia wuxianensis]|uniref:Uncharacterized protein n=1 Tax=Youxingia wuxianensis TaxID=2763678 RepID=A0A926ICP4_9FIRM|nr:hypothetical protein [Youxingia wuxianensis]MBC8585402.1 hypothetical protein [Youxingia wuxianensis]